MSNWWYNFYNKWIVRFLVKEPLKHGSYFLSHGFFHLVMCVLVFYLTYQWAKININTTETSFHDINLGMDYSIPHEGISDTLTMLDIDFVFDSDSILKYTNGKYRSQIRIIYEFDRNHGDLKNVDEPKDSFIINFYSRPFLQDLSVIQDPVYFEAIVDTVEDNDSCIGLSYDYLEHTVERTFLHDTLLSDSSIEVSVLPVKNHVLPNGVMTEGMQTIRFFSNQLGLNRHDSFWKNSSLSFLDAIWQKLGLASEDSYYNYYIGFGLLPEAVNTTRAYGHQSINIQFGDLTIRNLFYHNPNKKLLYQYIYPEPDIINNGFISYWSKESIDKVAKNHGIIIHAVDVDAQNRNARKSLISSILVGTGAALFFDIVIQLVRELRNLNRRKEEEEAEQQVKDEDQQDSKCEVNELNEEGSSTNDVVPEESESSIASDNTPTVESSIDTSDKIQQRYE